MRIAVLEYAEHLHPATRMVAADEALDVLDVWIERAWQSKLSEDCARFCFLVELREWLLENN